VRSELIKQNTKLIDEQFFALFSRLAQGAQASGQENATKQMDELQKQLLTETELGRQLQESVGELETAAKTLQEAGEKLTREKLIELVISAPNDARLRGYVSMARGGMDYTFFQTLTEKIDKTQGEEKKKLEGLREKLLDYINEVDRQVETRYKQAQDLIESILSKDDVEKAVKERLNEFTQDVVDLAAQLSRQASEKNDYARMGRLQKVLQVLQEASAPPPEVALIEKMLQTPDDASVEVLLKENESMVNDQFMEALSGLVAQMDAQSERGNPEAKSVASKLGQVYKIALKYSMKKKMNQKA